MTSDHEEDRPGIYSPPRAIPSAGNRTVAGPSPVAAPDPVAAGGRPTTTGSDERKGDPGSGRTLLTAPSHPLSPDDRRRLDEQQARQLEEERQRLEDFLASDGMVFRLPPFIAGPLALCALVGMVAVVGLFVLAQVTTTLSALRTFPAWAQPLGWLALLLLVSAFLYAGGRFVVAYLRLKPNQPLILKGLAQLSQRTRVRWLVHERKVEAKEMLVAYLREYPLASAGDRRALVAEGLSVETLTKLNAARLELMDGNRFANHDKWFQDFRDHFQVHLDQAASSRIAYFAWRVAVGTAASPNALIDALLVGYASLAMLADLCRIYHLRVGRLGTAVLLVRVLVNAYLAGQINDLQQMAEGGIEDLVKESGLHIHSAALDAALGKVAGKLGSRAGSGLLNYFFLKRLGIQAQALLRPVR